MWNKMLKQIESGRFYLQSSYVNRKLINMEKENVDDELLYKAAIAAAVVTIASGEIITVWKRN